MTTPARGDPREMTIRVTRIPLNPATIERLRDAGELPADYRSRSVEETDFVKVTAESDEDAAAKAYDNTRLVFAGEGARFEEVVGDGTFRPMVITGEGT